jgi:hypothetical protein
MSYLRLSEAVLLGDVAMQRDSLCFLKVGSSSCGCALGRALYAAGFKHNITGLQFDNDCRKETYTEIWKRWPWITRGQLTQVEEMFFSLCGTTSKGGITSIEQIADVIRGWEEIHDPQVREQREQQEDAVAIAEESKLVTAGTK